MPDTVKAFWQDVSQETADKLVGGERHHLLPIIPIAVIVLVAQSDAFVIERDHTTLASRPAPYPMTSSTRASWTLLSSDGRTIG